MRRRASWASRSPSPATRSSRNGRNVNEGEDVRLPSKEPVLPATTILAPSASASAVELELLEVRAPHRARQRATLVAQLEVDLGLRAAQVPHLAEHLDRGELAQALLELGREAAHRVRAGQRPLRCRWAAVASIRSRSGADEDGIGHRGPLAAAPWSPDVDAARDYARDRAGSVSFTVRTERRAWGYRGDRVDRSASVVKATPMAVLPQPRRMCAGCSPGAGELRVAEPDDPALGQRWPVTRAHNALKTPPLTRLARRARMRLVRHRAVVGRHSHRRRRDEYVASS